MMVRSTRREALGAIAASGLIAAGSRAAADAASTQDDLMRYLDFGAKASGGPGDDACGAWLEDRLRSLGFSTRRQVFEVPFGETTGSVILDDVATPVWCAPTQDAIALEGTPLAHLDDPRGAAGCIAVTTLPFRRWSSASAPPVRQAVARAREAGARALLLVTDGPTGGTIALNLSAGEPPAVPIATVGSRAAAPLLTAAWRRTPASGVIRGRSGRRPAFNVVGETGTQGLRLVFSTPRSGWFACGGERGPGVAVWLALAQWAAAARDVRATFLATSGHEFEGLGAERYLAEQAPAPEDVDLWVHLGANLATRDARDLGADLQFLPSVDPQHYLVGHAGIRTVAETAFSGLPGLDRAFDPRGGAAGELQTLIDHGYRRLLGVFGAHRLHHTEIDDARSLSADQVRQVGSAFMAVLDAVRLQPGSATDAAL